MNRSVVISQAVVTLADSHHFVMDNALCRLISALEMIYINVYVPVNSILSQISSR